MNIGYSRALVTVHHPRTHARAHTHTLQLQPLPQMLARLLTCYQVATCKKEYGLRVIPVGTAYLVTKIIFA
jgi:hypothetical protein